MAKGPIEFIDDLSVKKVSWEDQTDSDKKGYTSFMMNKWISMSRDWVDIIAETQRYTAIMSPKINYLFYLDILPRQKVWIKYAANKSEKTKELSSLISLVSAKLFVSEKEAADYIDILIQTGKISDLTEWVKQYGYTEKETDKIFKAK